MIIDYLKNNILITDGAMGTYYSQIKGNRSVFSETANISEPDIIKNIHLEYINAGAKLIRTNTFSANTITLKLERQKVAELIKEGYKIAKAASLEKDIFVAASIGPIPETSYEKTEIDSDYVLEEYKFIVDTFLEEGTDIFIFETFSGTEYLKAISEYIKIKSPSAFIVTQFALNLEGYTRKGISSGRIINEIKAIDTIDAYGFNCGVGPTHLYNSLKKYEFSKDIVSVLPNAGYPEVINERTVYVQNTEYFANIMMNIKKLGVKIIGGCCGTTPEHIKKICEKMNGKSSESTEVLKSVINQKSAKSKTSKLENSFYNKMKQNKFMIAVELDPPLDTSVEKIINGAKLLKEQGVDVITIADSPRGRARADSVILASKIKREADIEVIPHICCRDKNFNALRSSILAGHIDNIRNILAVTGDPVPGASKSEIMNVFNLNSFKLIELISEMNKEVFIGEEFCIGGALNLNVLKKDNEVERMNKKAEKGASFFFTQPIYSDEVIEYLPQIQKREDTKIFAGIMPIVTYNNAQFLNNEMPGFHIPKEHIDRFSMDMSREEAEEIGITLAVELAEKIRPYADGFYFVTPFNRVEMIVKIINMLSNK